MTSNSLAWLGRGLGKLHAYAATQVYRLEHRAFDWYSGAETTGRTETSVDAYNAGTENWPYLGCQWPALPFVLKDLPYDGTFVDLGSGKGKALLSFITSPGKGNQRLNAAQGSGTSPEPAERRWNGGAVHPPMISTSTA